MFEYMGSKDETPEPEEGSWWPVVLFWVIFAIVLWFANSLFANSNAKIKREVEQMENERTTRVVSDFEDCKVYRFFDRGFHYYTHCKDGSTPQVEDKTK